MKSRNINPLSIGNGADWQFMNGVWVDGEGGQLSPADDAVFSDGEGIQGHHYAFLTGASYEDVRVRYEFRLNPHSDAGIILRATDESHFYLLHCPNCGQASRAQHFWVALSRMDDTGYLKLIKLDMIRRVPSNSGLWLPMHIALSGGKISVDVGDHGRFQAEDDGLAGSGCVGVYSYRRADIRNVVVEGEEQPPSWSNGPCHRTNWFNPCPDTVYGVSQQPLDLLRLPSGALLLNYHVDKDGPFAGDKTPLARWSRDNGRSWSEPELVRVACEDGRWLPVRMWLTPGGRLICVALTQSGYVFAESGDEGRTWSEPAAVEVEVPAGMRGLHIGPQAFLNLADSSMLWFTYGGYALDDAGLAVSNWGSLHCRSFCLRSTDDGRTWSSPVNMDNSADLGVSGQNGSLDLTEVCAAQMGDGRIMALIRPIYSPWMWETWSSDGGATWGPCVRGEFPGYAAPSMLRTGSGKVLVAHRLPSLTIHCSPDEGHTWDQGTTIDGSLWAMGSMIELEPDLVLYVYSATTLMRGQFIRVAPSGLKPVRAIDAIYFMFHPVCWEIGMDGGEPPSGSDSEHYLGCLEWERRVNEQQRSFIRGMKPSEALVIFPVGSKQPMVELQEYATSVLGSRCIIVDRNATGVPASWRELPDVIKRFLDDDDLEGKSDFLKNVPPDIHSELQSEIREACAIHGYGWDTAALKVIYYSRLAAMDIRRQFDERGLWFDADTVISESFGEGFEQCAMTWKAMLVPYLGFARPSDSIFDLSVSGAELLLGATFRERVALGDDVCLYLWEGRRGWPIGLYARSWCRLRDPRFHARVSVDGASFEVGDICGGCVPVEASLLPCRDGRLDVPIMNAIRRDPLDGPFYLVGREMSFDAFRGRLVGAEISASSDCTDGA